MLAQTQPAYVPVPPLRGPINDYAHVLQGQVQALERTLVRLHEDTGVQLVVLTWPTLDGQPLAPFATAVMDKWKLGLPGEDLGLLLLLVPGDRKNRLEVGYGLEGVVPDAVAKRLLAEELRPQLEGSTLTAREVGAAVAALDKLIRRSHRDGSLVHRQGSRAQSAEQGLTTEQLLWALFVALVVVAIATRLLLAAIPRFGETQSSAFAADARRPPPSHFLYSLVRLLLLFFSAGRGPRDGPGGSGYSGGGGRSGGGGADDRY